MKAIKMCVNNIAAKVKLAIKWQIHVTMTMTIPDDDDNDNDDDDDGNGAATDAFRWEIRWPMPSTYRSQAEA